MLKNRIKKIEGRLPKPEPDNIIYTAVWGHEAKPEEEGTFIAEWKDNGAQVKQYKMPDGGIREKATYKTHWPSGRRFSSSEQTGQN